MFFSGHTYTNSQLNTAPTSLLHIASTRNKLSGNKMPTIKQELELKLEIGNEGKLQQYAKNFVTMSAPPSPMLSSKSNTNLLQELLNSQNKISYTPDYSQSQIQTHVTGDPHANEITQLISNTQHSSDMSYRSQSVPLQPNLVTSLNQSPYFSQFSFNLTESETNPHVNEFPELETLTENEDINVNKIINALEDTTNETALRSNDNDPLTDGMEIEHNVFDNIDVSLTNLPDDNGYATTGNMNFGHHFKGRSQSVDIDLSSTSLRFNPSRSVPSTPLPVSKGSLIGDKIVGQSSRSYPSTPLLSSESFTYNQEYLLNTQVVKEESVNSLDMQAPLETLDMLNNAEDVLYNNMEFYSMNDVNVNSDVLAECNKQNFSLSRQIVESNIETKGNEHCMIVENEQNFDGGISSS